MDNIFDHIIGMAIVTVFMFLLLGLILFDAESNLNSSIQDATSEFVNESCITGEISADAYKDFVKKVCRYGQYDIRLTVETDVAYPAVSLSGKKGVRMGQDSFPGKNITGYMFPEAYKDTYGNWVQPDEQNYALKTGDRLTVTVVRKSSLTSGFMRAFSGRSNSDTVITTYHNVSGITGEGAYE